MHGARAFDPVPRSAPIHSAPILSAPIHAAAIHPAATPALRGPLRRVLWVGEIDDLELTIARESLVRLTGCIVIRATAPAPSSPSSHHGSDLLGTSPPDCILLAIDRPGRWSVEQVLGLSLSFPLTPIFAIATSLGDGRRRSGPPLPGVEELAWHDAGGRLARWFADLDAGLPGSLGLPPTVRREERFHEAPAFQPQSRPVGPLAPVTVAARSPLDLEGLVDLLAAAGHPIGERTLLRPQLSPPDRLVVWDAGRFDNADLEWLRLLVANRPGVAVVILDSFPRGDVARGALRAGASAILGRPVGLEVLAGTLRGLCQFAVRG
jgi:hypothetical protein